VKKYCPSVCVRRSSPSCDWQASNGKAAARDRHASGPDVGRRSRGTIKGTQAYGAKREISRMMVDIAANIRSLRSVVFMEPPAGYFSHCVCWFLGLTNVLLIGARWESGLPGCRNTSARHRVCPVPRTRRLAGSGPDDATATPDAVRRSSPPDICRMFWVRSCAERFRWNRRGERDHDKRVSDRVEHEFESADVAAIDLLRERSILLVLDVDATGRADPGHGTLTRHAAGACDGDTQTGRRCGMRKSPSVRPAARRSAPSSDRRGVCRTRGRAVAGLASRGSS
jgi:hypothetical protein